MRLKPTLSLITLFLLAYMYPEQYKPVFNCLNHYTHSHIVTNTYEYRVAKQFKTKAYLSSQAT